MTGTVLFHRGSGSCHDSPRCSLSLNGVSTRAGQDHLGSSLNFEDRIGAGLKFANGQSVGVRAIHYSNAGLKQPNDGIESYSLFYKIPI
ncbi:acyloxyacyl hydrolase [Pseudomonas aeruginosa]|uniref:acyloxyacyl hydrolase n=1 Tax=Pseudomonas aeruginosa TaxID=287 RepID=UPI0021ABBF94|nr:acyloxyacyl hydrolase [Pseudomonas aeruginosa]